MSIKPLTELNIICWPPIYKIMRRLILAVQTKNQAKSLTSIAKASILDVHR